jgi:hypothetical protein
MVAMVCGEVLRGIMFVSLAVMEHQALMEQPLAGIPTLLVGQQLRLPN